jgi:hypothetical protein
LFTRTSKVEKLLNASLEDLINISSYKDPTKYTLVEVTAPVALKPIEDKVVATEDMEYEVQYWNFGYNEITSWTFESDSTWLSWDSEKHILYGTPDNSDVGTCWVRLNITDGQGNYDEHFFNINVNNTLPTIDTENVIFANQSQYYYVDYYSDDEGLGDTKWSLNSNPSIESWLHLDPDTGILNGTPGQDDVGTYDINITVNDGNSGLNWTNFKLEVIDIDYAPEIIGTPITSTNEDELYYVNFQGVDKDNDLNLIWDLQTEAKFLSIDFTGNLSGTPTNDDVGSYFVNVNVKDSIGLIDFINFTLGVINVNDPPEIITNDRTTAITGQQYEIDYDATDVDSNISDQLWTLETDASWLTINEISGLLSGVPPHSTDLGWFSVNVTVSDGDGGIDWQNFLLNILKGNEPPVITTEDIGYAEVNQSYQIKYKAVDDSTPEELLFWLLETNASWLEIDSESGVLSGTPTINDAGYSYWVNISVQDTEYGSSYHYFWIKVLPEPKRVNTIPKLMNFKMDPSEGDTETKFTFSVYYSDGDSEPPIKIQVVVDDTPFDMVLQIDELNYRGIYEFKTKLTEGEHIYYFTASDGIDSVRSDDFTTPYISEPTDESSKEEKGTGTIVIGAIVVVIIIVILILIFLMLHGKKKKEDKKEEQKTTSLEQPLTYPPNVYPTVITPQMPQQQVQPQDNIYMGSPPTDTATYDTTPSYSTPEQQQEVIPSITEQPQEPFIQPEPQEEIQDLDEE